MDEHSSESFAFKFCPPLSRAYHRNFCLLTIRDGNHDTIYNGKLSLRTFGQGGTEGKGKSNGTIRDGNHLEWLRSQKAKVMFRILYHDIWYP